MIVLPPQNSGTLEPFQTVLFGLLGCASEVSDVWFNFDDEDAKGIRAN